MIRHGEIFCDFCDSKFVIGVEGDGTCIENKTKTSHMCSDCVTICVAIVAKKMKSKPKDLNRKAKNGPIRNTL